MAFNIQPKITALVCLLSFAILLTACKKEHKTNQDKPNISTLSVKEVDSIDLFSGKIERIELFPSKYIQPRNVDIWIPDHYDKKRKFDVLYMHDGQMLFDETKTWNKQEWEVDEIASKLMKENKVRDFIVVAIWNVSETRWQDYYPEKTWTHIPEATKKKLVNEGKGKWFEINFHADNYLKFITQELKPFIDQNYAVNRERENTFVAGSSMGGLISMYALFEYPEVFAGAACLSTHWTGTIPREDNPMAKGFFDYMRATPLDFKTHKIYFDYGTETLDADYIQYAETVDDIFKTKGADSKNYANLRFEGALHDEISWAKRLDIPLTFLLNNQNR